MWIKNMHRLRRLTPRQLRDYYNRQLRLFWTDRMTFPSGRSSLTPFQRRHNSGQWGWGGRVVTRERIAKLKVIRQMLRDGYEREEPKAKGPGVCAVDREDEARQRDPAKGDRHYY